MRIQEKARGVGFDWDNQDQVWEKVQLNYILFSLAMGGVFSFIVWHLGDWPSFNGNFTQNQHFTWAYIIFHGIIGHHFYLDQKIWRPSQQKDLKSYLN